MDRRSRALIILAGLAALLAAPARTARPIEPARKPTAAHRVVRVFDFEEQAVNPDPVPMRWVRGQDSPDRPRPGFPAWNRARFDSTQARSGDASVLLSARGGSTALALVSGVIPVAPGGVYEVSAWARGTGLVNARARLRATLRTDTHDAIPGAGAVSDPFTGATDGWRRLTVRLTAGPEAAWLTINLELLQPSQRPDADALSPDARLDDLDARVWFDDVTVRLAPVLTLGVGGPAGLSLGPTPPAVSVLIDDVAGDPLTARLTITDDRSAVVHDRNIDPVRPGVGEVWTPDLPGFGWFTARLTVLAEGEPIAEASRAFVWAPDDSGSSHADGFGVALRETDHDLGTLLELISATRAGAVDAPLWAGVETRDDFGRSIAGLTALLESLQSSGIEVGLTLDTLPVELSRATRFEPGRVVEALADPDRPAEAWLDEALSRFGQRVGRWRLGPMRRAPGHDADADADTDADRFPDAAGPMRERVLNPAIRLTLPMHTPPARAMDLASAAWVWPAELPPRAIVDLIAAEPGLARSEFILTLDRTLPPRARAIDVARRAVRAQQAGVERLTLAQPWTWRDADAEPDAALAVWREVARRLDGRRVVGELPVNAGAVALVLDGPAGGAIVAWNEWAEPADAVLAGYLADGAVRVVDLFGNEAVAPLRAGRHTIALPEAPIFIEGVDAALARFRAGFRVTPAHVESTAERHDLTLRLTNPWPVAIAGALRVVGPAGWDFTPSERRFALDPGAEAELPVTASFGLATEAGPDRLRAEVSLVAAERYPVLTLEAPIELGLTGVELLPSYEVRRRDGRADLVVTLLVINTGESPMTMTAYAQAPGRARQQAPVSDLAPRASAVRRFVFRDAGDALTGRDVRVGVIESVGLGRLTMRLHID